MKRRPFLGTAFAGAGPCLSQSSGAAPTGKLPARRRFFYNDDGDSSLFCYQGPFRREQVTDAADVLAGTPVTTLVLCVCYSDTFTYPSQVGVMQGWRKTRSHESGYYQRVYDFFQFVRRNNWDIPGMVKERAAGSG